MIDPRPSPLPHALLTVLFACAISPAAAQLAPGEATIFRLAINEELGMGSALATGDFDGDGADDLAMGAPLAADGGLVGSGVVVLRYDGGGVQLLSQSSSGLAVAEAGDRYGAALAAGDLDCDGYDDLAVGIPWEDVGNSLDTGAVLVYYGSAGGLPSAAGDLLLLADVDASGNQNFADFGTVLTVLDYGTVTELAIASPLHDIPLASDTGAVYVVPHECPGVGFQTDSTLRLIQGVGGVSGFADDGDVFGSALAGGDFNGDGRVDLGIGAPGNTWGATPEGAIQVFYGAVGGLGIGDDGSGTRTATAFPVQRRTGISSVLPSPPRISTVTATTISRSACRARTSGRSLRPVASTFSMARPPALPVAPVSTSTRTMQASWVRPKPRTTSARRSPPETSTATAAPTWRSAFRTRTSASSPMPASSMSSTEPPRDYSPSAVRASTKTRCRRPQRTPTRITSARSSRRSISTATASRISWPRRRTIASTASGGLVAVVPGRPLFADGFEIGDTSAWSLTVP